MGNVLKVGIDEAGRGPLAGPVVSAAVIIKEKIPGVKDSKKLTPKAREKLFDLIISKAVAVGIGVATVEEIDKFNILNATILSMRRAIDNLLILLKNKDILSNRSLLILVDGNKTIDGIPFKQKAVVSGDNLIYEISCASIVAKVYRDRIMDSFSNIYPQYGFDKHKGYGTKKHFEAIQAYGITKIHRVTFLKKFSDEKLFG